MIVSPAGDDKSLPAGTIFAHSEKMAARYHAVSRISMMSSSRSTGRGLPDA